MASYVRLKTGQVVEVYHRYKNGIGYVGEHGINTVFEGEYEEVDSQEFEWIKTATPERLLDELEWCAQVLGSEYEECGRQLYAQETIGLLRAEILKRIQ